MAHRKNLPQAVVAVVPDGRGRLLVVRRSRQVVAPGKLCFPGGMLHPGETPEAALVRELREELAVEAQPLRTLWTSTAPWQVELTWLLARLVQPESIRPNSEEIEAVYWMTPQQLQQSPDLLESNRPFLAAWARGELALD